MRGLVLLVAACGIPEERFPERAALAICDRTYDCAQGEFEIRYDDTDDCVDKVEDDVSWILDGVQDFSDCHYVPERGRECVQGIRSVECGDFVSGRWLEECEGLCD